MSLAPYLGYLIALALALIIGAIIGGIYVMAKMGARVMRHNYVCTKCGDAFRLWALDEETAHERRTDDQKTDL